MLFRSIVLALIALVPAAALAADSKARDAVNQHLTKLKGATGAQLFAVDDEPVAKALGSLQCFSVWYRKYPVARKPPEPLKVNNLFVVKPDGMIEHLTSTADLEKLLQAKLPPVKSEADARAAARAWLRLSQEFHQDGFFIFTIHDEMKVVGAGGKPMTVTAVNKVEPEKGNKGEIKVTLEFDKDGKLAKAREEAKVTAGTRPKCQATKLLDPDPIVRGMAEDAILLMGRACQYYLDEQRAQAVPDLQKAIDRVWQRIVEEDR